jgi:hypothetical protein
MILTIQFMIIITSMNFRSLAAIHQGFDAP